MNRFFLTTLVGFLLVGAAAAAVAAQGIGRAKAPGQAEGPPIVSVHATVEDMATKQEIGIVERSGHFQVRQGQQVRLRLVAEAAGNRKRYPSTDYVVNRGRHISVDRINPEVGAVIVTGGAPNERGGAVPIQYEILENLQVDDDLRTGRFYLDIIPAQAAPQPTPEPEPEAVVYGATLYEHADFRGRSERITADDFSFRDNLIGNDTVSSVRVDAGCVVALYRDENFRGGVTELREDAYNLEGTGVGNDAMSSLRIDCEAPRRGVTLFADADFRGTSEFFFGEVADLTRSRIGNDRASSIRIDERCEVTLFGDANFRGRSHTFRDSLPRLNGTNVGNDAVSSLRVSCW